MAEQPTASATGREGEAARPRGLRRPDNQPALDTAHGQRVEGHTPGQWRGPGAHCSGHQCPLSWAAPRGHLHLQKPQRKEEQAPRCPATPTCISRRQDSVWAEAARSLETPSPWIGRAGGARGPATWRLSRAPPGRAGKGTYPHGRPRPHRPRAAHRGAGPASGG